MQGRVERFAGHGALQGFLTPQANAFSISSRFRFRNQAAKNISATHTAKSAIETYIITLSDAAPAVDLSSRSAALEEPVSGAPDFVAAGAFRRQAP